MTKTPKKWQVFSAGATAKAKDVRERARLRFQNLLTELFGILLSPWKFFKIFCFSIGLAVMAGSVTVSLYVHRFFKSIPNLDQVTPDDLQHLGENLVTRKLE